MKCAALFWTILADLFVFSEREFTFTFVKNEQIRQETRELKSKVNWNVFMAHDVRG